MIPTFASSFHWWSPLWLRHKTPLEKHWLLVSYVYVFLLVFLVVLVTLYVFTSFTLLILFDSCTKLNSFYNKSNKAAGPSSFMQKAKEGTKATHELGSQNTSKKGSWIWLLFHAVFPWVPAAFVYWPNFPKFLKETKLNLKLFLVFSMLRKKKGKMA